MAVKDAGLLVLPGYYQPWHWLHRINKYLSFWKNDFNHLHNIQFKILNLFSTGRVKLYCINELYGVYVPFNVFIHLAVTKQLYEWSCPSVHPSICHFVCPSIHPSVCHTLFTMFLKSFHHEMFRDHYSWQKWCPCHRPRLDFKGQGHTCQKKFVPV